MLSAFTIPPCVLFSYSSCCDPLETNSKLSVPPVASMLLRNKSQHLANFLRLSLRFLLASKITIPSTTRKTLVSVFSTQVCARLALHLLQCCLQCSFYNEAFSDENWKLLAPHFNFSPPLFYAFPPEHSAPSDFYKLVYLFVYCLSVTTRMFILWKRGLLVFVHAVSLIWVQGLAHAFLLIGVAWMAYILT